MQTAPIQIKVYDNELFFSNMGGLPEPLTPEKLFEKHSSMPPNPDIAHVFYLAGYIESWGQGIQKICNACIAEGIDLPVYDVTADNVMVTLKTTEAKAKGLEGSISRATGTVNGTVNGTVKKEGRTADLGSRDHATLSLIRGNPSISRKEIAAELNVSERTAARAISSLKGKGLIKRTGSDKKGSWIILDE